MARFSRTMLAKSCKPYFQCLLVLQELFSRGLIEFSHTAFGTYYIVVLHADHPANVDANAKQKKLLEDMGKEVTHIVKEGGEHGGEGFVMSGGESSDAESVFDAIEPAPKRPRASPENIGGGVIGSDYGGSDPDVSGDGLSDSPVASSSSSVDSDHGPEPLEFVKEVMVHNMRITLEDFTHKSRPGRSHKRYVLRCRGCGHGHRCEKRRGCGLRQCQNHGNLEPAAFIWAWYELGTACATGKQHNRKVPTAAQVAAAVRKLQDLGY